MGDYITLSIEMMLNSGNNAFYGVFMSLHHSLGFPSTILEGGPFDPLDPLDLPLTWMRFNAFESFDKALPTK